MRKSDIRRVIDASLSGMKLSPQQRRDLAERAMRNEGTPPRRKIPRGLLIAAIIALVTLAVVVPAVGGQSHEAKIQTDGDFVRVRIGRDEDSGESFEAGTIPERAAEIWGAEFCEKLVEWNSQVLLPKWVPDGFALDEVEILDHCAQVWLRSEDPEQTSIHLCVEVLPEDRDSHTTISVPSEPGSEETWEYGGINYVYSTNYDRNSVVWTEGNCAVNLFAPRDRDAMRRMIASIYE